MNTSISVGTICEHAADCSSRRRFVISFLAATALRQGQAQAPLIARAGIWAVCFLRDWLLGKAADSVCDAMTGNPDKDKVEKRLAEIERQLGTLFAPASAAIRAAIGGPNVTMAAFTTAVDNALSQSSLMVRVNAIDTNLRQKMGDLERRISAIEAQLEPLVRERQQFLRQRFIATGFDRDPPLYVRIEPNGMSREVAEIWDKVGDIRPTGYIREGGSVRWYPVRVPLVDGVHATPVGEVRVVRTDGRTWIEGYISSQFLQNEAESTGEVASKFEELVQRSGFEWRDWHVGTVDRFADPIKIAHEEEPGTWKSWKLESAEDAAFLRSCFMRLGCTIDGARRIRGSMFFAYVPA